MNRKAVLLGLLLAIVLQVGVLSGEYFSAVYPLWTGREIRLKTLPIDPRSLFRGNYVRLRYGVSLIPSNAYTETRRLRNEETVFVSLKPGPMGLFEFERFSLQQPRSGIFLRGRVINRQHSKQADIRVRYGIEAWFAPKEKALQLQRDLRSGGVAVVMVAKNGDAVLKSIERETTSD